MKIQTVIRLIGIVLGLALVILQRSSGLLILLGIAIFTVSVWPWLSKDTFGL